MSVWRSARAGLRALFRRDAADREIDEELRHYLELATNEKMRAGLPRAEAERAAGLEVGGIVQSREAVRGSGWESHVESLWRDLRYAARNLRRSPGVTATVMLTLALGVGVNTTMFSVVNAVMLRDLPYRDANRLALIWTDDVRRGMHQEPTAYRTIIEWRQRTRAFDDIALYARDRVALPSNDPAIPRGRARGSLASGNLFAVLGVSPLLGRTFSAADDANRSDVVVISYAFWQRWFGGAPDVVGRTLTVEDASKGLGSRLTVIGVMPPAFYFPDKATEYWTPAKTYWRFNRESTELFAGWARHWNAVGRLSPAVSLDQAQREMARVGRELAAAYPTDRPDFPGFGTTVVSAIDAITGVSLRATLWLLFGATLLVLLIACANVANLLLARGTSRQHEFAVRRALGGGRLRLARLLITESLLMAIGGAAIGVAVGAGMTPLVSRMAAGYVPRVEEARIDVVVLAFATAMAIASAVVFGAIPAFRLSGAQASHALREGRRTTGTKRLRAVRGFAVLAQCSLAILLLTGAGLLLRSLSRINDVNPGFDPRSVLTVRVEFPTETPLTAEERAGGQGAEAARARTRVQSAVSIEQRVRAIPAVVSVGFVDDLFLAGQPNKTIAIPGRSDQTASELNDGTVTPDFFRVMRVPLIKGRYLTREDAEQKIRALWSPPIVDGSLADKERLATPEPVVVNESFARRFFANEDPVGKRFCIDPTGKTYWYVIVGVVGDMHRRGLERDAVPEYFGSYLPSSNGRSDLVVRVNGDPLTIAPAIRQAVARAVPGINVVTISTADAGLGDFVVARQLETWLLVAFAALALTLAATGIFGLVHYAVAERTREIGIRIALGATPQRVLGAVISRGMGMPVIGIVVGLVASAGLTRIMAGLLFGVGATDPTTFATVALLLATVALIACYLAGRRGTRVDPVQALRES